MPHSQASESTGSKKTVKNNYRDQSQASFISEKGPYRRRETLGDRLGVESNA